jgi:hypothetical protein
MPSALVHPSFSPPSIADTLERTYTPGSEHFVARQLEQIYRSRSTSLYHQQRIRADECFSHLNDLPQTRVDWNTYKSPAPSPKTIEVARRVTHWFLGQGLVPDRVRPSAEGGVALAFIGVGSNRAIAELLNNGEQFILLYDLSGANETIEWAEALPSSSDFLRLSNHLRGQ